MAQLGHLIFVEVFRWLDLGLVGVDDLEFKLIGL